jgi:hypothetical protein
MHPQHAAADGGLLALADQPNVNRPCRSIRAVEVRPMQTFRISLSDGTRKFHTVIQAPDSASAHIKAAYFFDTSKWRILSVSLTGASAVAA